MHARSCFVIVLSTIFVASVSSCSNSESYGDALSYGTGKLRTTKLPFFTLGQAGTYTYSVSGTTATPYKLRIETRDSGGYFLDTPFDRARVRVELLDSGNGAILATKTASLSRWRARPGPGEFDVTLWGSGGASIGGRDHYRVRVIVLEPSRRAADKARVYLE